MSEAKTVLATMPAEGLGAIAIKADTLEGSMPDERSEDRLATIPVFKAPRIR